MSAPGPLRRPIHPDAKLDLNERSVRDAVAVAVALRDRPRLVWYAERCLAWCRRVCDVEAEDLVQNAFTLLLGKGPRRPCTYDEVLQWMIITIRNLSRNHWNFERKMKAAEDADLPAVGDVDDAEWQALLILFRDAIGPACESLPERQHKILRGYYFGCLKVSELAEMLGISEPSVRKHRQRALEALKEKLGWFGP